MIEQQGKVPANLIDKDLLTTWAPEGTEAGALTYHVGSPLKADGTPYVGVRVISHGEPSNVTVKAVLYTDDTYTKTATVELGLDDEVLKEFSFGLPNAAERSLAEYTAVKDIVFEWAEGTEPELSEVYLLRRHDGCEHRTTWPPCRRRSTPPSSRTLAPGPPTPRPRSPAPSRRLSRP